MLASVILSINRTNHRVDGEADRSLLSVLRDDLKLTGSKYGCGEGQCGACTVLVDGVPTRSCITPVDHVVGQQITTIEGLEQNGQLHPVQQAFLEADAMQCGFCTPGMILSGVALLQKKADPSVPEMVRFMQGHICRCGTYPRIVTALQKAAQNMKGRGHE